YIAPELIMGQEGGVQSDIYALGIMLFEMLVGQPPFKDELPASLLLKHLHNDPPLPSSINTSLNPEIDSIILKALAKEPGNRYSSVVEMLHALQAVQPIATDFETVQFA